MDADPINRRHPCADPRRTLALAVATALASAALLSPPATTIVTATELRPTDAPDAPQPPAGTVPVFPRPGGGPQVIQALSEGSFWSSELQSYLLNPVTGEYQRLPFNQVVLSPDRRWVAVEDEGRVGVASRHAILAAGPNAVRWTELPPGSPSWWSPDGTALLVTTLDKETRLFVAHRYDLAGGQIRSTPIDLGDLCIAGWATDSTRYVVMLRSPDPAVLEGPIQYLNPDGTAGPLLGADGVLRTAAAYSPTRRYAIVEPVRPVELSPPPVIVDLRTGRTVTEIDTEWPLLGWYDAHRVVRVAPGEPETVLEVVDIRTGAVSIRVDAPGLPVFQLQLGSSRGLFGTAAELGF